jgi:hypothetical protein
MKLIKLFIFILFSTFCKAQTMPAPLPPLSSEKEAIIDEMIKATKYESSFYSNCILSVRFYGDKNNWKENKIQEVMKSIRFSDFKPIFCSYFSYLTDDEIKSITTLFSKLNNNHHDDFMINNNSLNGELEFYIRKVIGSQYLKK